MKNYVIILDSLPDKKIKSIGNRCLIKIRKNHTVLDYHIQTAKKIFNKNLQIIVVGGFESKKLKKYLYSKYNNIIYIEYTVSDYTNIGSILALAFKNIEEGNCLIWNTNHILHNNAINKIQSSLLNNQSFIIYSRSKGDIGLIIGNNSVINCYYGLPYNLYDIIYINNKDISRLLTYDMNKLYLFEIINRCIDDDIAISPVLINSKYITIINSTNNIEKVKKKLCSI